MSAIWRRSSSAFLSRRFIGHSKRTSYYVLLPEVPPETPASSAILRTQELLDYPSVSGNDCYNAIAKLALDHESGIWRLEKELSDPDHKPTIKLIVEPIEKLSAPLEAAWGVAKTLYVTNSNIMSAETYKMIHNRTRQARSVRFQSKPIYEACKAVLSEDAVLGNPEKRFLTKFVLEGRLNGLDMNDKSRTNYVSTCRKIEKEKAEFQAKVEKATQIFNHTITDRLTVRDFPSDLLRATAVNSNSPSQGPWKVTLEPHILTPFMEHCPDPLLRWNVWRAFRSRGSPGQNKELSTSFNLEEIRFQRRDQAKLLGYGSFADISMETKMAGSVQNVNKMIEDLMEKAFVLQRKELDSLQQFAKSRAFDGNLEMWDVAYWRRKQRAALFKYEEGEVCEYFPLPRVFSGLLGLLEQVFGIIFEEIPSETAWHPDVTIYSVRNRQGELCGHVYFDPYSRIGQKLLSRESASWTIGMRSRSDIVGHTPVAAIVLNLASPRHGIPCLMSFNQVQTLFTKMGHALQHIMTQSPYSEVAGMTNMEWDVVNVSGQFLQCWLNDWPTMTKISGHFESGQPLSKETFQQLNKASVHMAATDICQQLYLSALDLELHSTRDFWLDVVKRLWPKFQAFPLDKTDSHPCSFTDIVSGDWAAAYYSHIWSRMVAADIFSAFQEVSSDDEAAVQKLGDRYRNIVLGHGGGCHPSETFRQFRGRDPSPDALLALIGLRKPLEHCSEP